MRNEELVTLYQSGDELALNQLIEKNMGVINKIVNVYVPFIDNKNHIERLDLEQEGVLGLIMAAKNYNLDMQDKAKFITYAFQCIKNKVHGFINNKNSELQEVSLSDPVGDNNSTREEFIADDNDPIEAIEEVIYKQYLRESVRKLLKDELTLFEREVIELRYGFDCRENTLHEISEIFSTNSSNVRNTEVKAIKKLRKSKWMREMAKEKLVELDYDRFGDIEIKETINKIFDLT